MDQGLSKCSNARWWLAYTIVGLLCWPEVGAAADEGNATRTTQPGQTASHAPPPLDGRSLDNWVTGGEWDIPKDPSKFHIFIFAGQSNMAGGFKESHLYDDEGNYDPVTDPVPRVLQYRGKTWQPAAHPLTRHVKRSFSIPLPFAQKYLEEINDPDVKVGLVIRAFGGKAIDHFTRGGAYHPGPGLKELKKQGTFKGFIWHQGESDTTRVYRFTTYERKLHGLVADVRGYLDQPDLPFVTGQISRYGSNDEPEKEFWSESIGVVTRVLANVGDKMDHAAHVRSSGAATCTEHIRKLVDENGKPTGKTMRMRSDPVHFNRSGYTTMAHRYVNAVLDRPSFKNDPVRITSVPGRAFSGSLAGEVSDLSKDKLTFSWRGTPDWLAITPDGAVSGTAPAAGTCSCTVSVTDKSGFVDTVKLLVVAKQAVPPEFSDDAFKRSPAIAGKEYKDRVRFERSKAWSSEVCELNGDPVTFSKVSGPEWLEVSPDGTFSGTPHAEDAGKTITFAVRAADVDGADTATYSLDVLASNTAWIEGFDYYPDIKQKTVGDVVHFNAGSPTDTWFVIHGSFPVNEPKVYSDLHTSLSGQMHKFSKGTVCARAIALDESRFSGKRGRYRFRFNLFGVSPEDAHFFVSIYDIDLGAAIENGCTIELVNKKSRGVAANVVAKGNATVTKVAERDYRIADGTGFKDLDFEYDGDGDVLVVFSASRDTAERGGGSQFDDLRVVAVDDASQANAPTKH